MALFGVYIGLDEFDRDMRDLDDLDNDELDEFDRDEEKHTVEHEDPHAKERHQQVMDWKHGEEQLRLGVEHYKRMDKEFMGMLRLDYLTQMTFKRRHLNTFMNKLQKIFWSEISTDDHYKAFAKTHNLRNPRELYKRRGIHRHRIPNRLNILYGTLAYMTQFHNRVITFAIHTRKYFS